MVGGSTRGRATIACTRNFQRQPENAIQYAIGTPNKSNNTDTAKANCSVSQNVCQSMAMRLVYLFNRTCTSHAAGWGDNAVHPKIHRHLAIMIEAMGSDRHGEPQAGNGSFSER